jgi:hypothetical protein
MSFIKKIWKDRISEYPTRRNLEKSDGSSELVTVSRSEGNISQEGDAFSAENMNDLEERISNEFEALNTNITNKFQAPDYTNKQVISSNTYTVTEDGYVALYVHKGNNGVFQSATYRGTLTINGTVVLYYSNTISSNEIRIYPAIRSGLYPVKAGDTVKFSVTNADSYERAFFPAR